MDGTDEVWVAGDRGDSDGSAPDGAYALMEFEHGGSVGFWFGFSFPKIWVLVAIANAAERQETAALPASRIRYPLARTL